MLKYSNLLRTSVPLADKPARGIIARARENGARARRLGKGRQYDVRSTQLRKLLVDNTRMLILKPKRYM